MKLVLIVEDEFGNAEVLRLLFEAEGYRVANASNGKVALELLKGEKPALILSDFMMPIMNGGELGNVVRSTPALSDIPFVFMSGTSEEVVRRSFGGYDGFLPKPFDFLAMLTLVERLIASGRPARPSSEDVDRSMRQLLKGIHLPPAA
ncbi:CheY-like chemotaxis protein [Variovorax boronicumulans]|uniref:response regulator n=1 Tax=Variovorax boronicumulans TaxID=436515 RepID=UPI0027896780|nr:response regulator [Variovorax boronicumulans]MDP9994421.1 CheY-like chemotaxis protein [Variovorax boronicumulans]MDQ0005880.1 CheY-like chemotaxis protein [Variovorax boronicumulans]MDQ0044503.1 CheY-like chemotaxis protein [Variovorax boronicumulans]